MEQRTLRLGDILDDYCTRERRVTNHAIVAMVEQDVKQTRCTTCDTEHVYKGGKAPRRKKPETAGALYKEVLAGITDDVAPAGVALAAAAPEGALEVVAVAAAVAVPVPVPIPVPVAVAPVVLAAAPVDTDLDEIDPDDPPPPRLDDGPVHRPLIRAQLARPEGIKIERQAPEFTIRQNSGRGGNGGNGGYRGNGGGDMRARGAGGGGPRTGSGGGSNNGQRFGRGPRPGGSNGGGGGRGPNQGFGRGPGGGGGQQRSGRPPKRSR
jgi:hypothetical protein